MMIDLKDLKTTSFEVETDTFHEAINKVSTVSEYVVPLQSIVMLRTTYSNLIVTRIDGSFYFDMTISVPEGCTLYDYCLLSCKNALLAVLDLPEEGTEDFVKIVMNTVPMTQGLVLLDAEPTIVNHVVISDDITKDPSFKLREGYRLTPFSHMLDLVTRKEIILNDTLKML